MSAPTPEPRSNFWSLLRSVFFSALFLALQMWYLPRWMGLHGSWRASEQEPMRWLGLIPLLVGAVISLQCMFRFGTEGRGTPAPFDPPRQLVLRGLYRRVRNPMYWGLAFLLAGETVLFADFNIRVLYYAVGLALIVHLFVLLYEEPT